jgi:hypothetical protein
MAGCFAYLVGNREENRLRAPVSTGKQIGAATSRRPEWEKNRGSEIAHATLHNQFGRP